MKASKTQQPRRGLVYCGVLNAALGLVTGGTGAFCFYASFRLPAGATLTIPVPAIGLSLVLIAIVNGLVLIGILQALRRMPQEGGDDGRA